MVRNYTTSDFEAFARGHGVILERIIADGEIHRARTVNKPKKRNGTYTWNGKWGWVYAFDGDKEVHRFPEWEERQRLVKTMSPEEQARIERAAKDAARKIAEKHAAAAREAADIITRCKVVEHGYMRLKGLLDVKVLVYEDAKLGPDVLFVPMRDPGTNALVGGQKIWWEAETRVWEKKMLYGTRAVDGAVLRLGNKKATSAILCEGFATGLSILKAVELAHLPWQVVCCFSDSGIVKAAEKIGGTRYVFADNDPITEADHKIAASRGIKVVGPGERAAVTTGLPYTMATRIGWDANDVFTEKGVYALAAMLMKLRPLNQ